MSLPSRITGVLAVAAVAALPVATAEAAIPLAKAKATAYRAGVAAAKQTHGHSPRVMSCAVKTARRDLCKVRLQYATGAKTCVLQVTVQYRSRRSTQLVYQFGQTLCS
jgi:hypothetical protein